MVQRLLDLRTLIIKRFGTRVISPLLVLEGLTLANNFVADRTIELSKQVAAGRRAPRKKPTLFAKAVEAGNDIAASLSARILTLAGEAVDVLTPFDESTVAGSIAEKVTDIPLKQLKELEEAVTRMIKATEMLRAAEQKIRTQTPRRK